MRKTQASVFGDGYHSTKPQAQLSPTVLKGEQCVMSKARGYLAKAKQCEKRAGEVRFPENREWQLILARAYRMLAQAASEERRPQQQAA